MFDFNIDTNILKNKKIDYNKLYDVVIIGGGPGALNAGLYAKRNNLSVLIISETSGGQLLNTNIIDNYLGYFNISGEKLNNNFENHLDYFDVKRLYNVSVNKLNKENNLFISELSNNQQIKSKTVILATGGNPRKLNIKGEKEFEGNGISYCVICDGAFYNNKDVLVVGGGNSALEAAIDLSNNAKSVHILQNLNNFTAEKTLVDKVLNNKKITYTFNANIIEFTGENALNKVIYKENDQLKMKYVDGVFIQIGIIPNSKLVKDLVNLNKFNEVVTNNEQKTSLEGLYAIGDVTSFKYKQVIMAASQGAVAALNINEYLNK